MDIDEPPTPHELADAPELAILATLEHALVTACHALIAANPELGAGDDLHEHYHVSPLEWTADVIIAHAALLRRTLAQYRNLLDRQHQHARASTDDDDF